MEQFLDQWNEFANKYCDKFKEGEAPRFEELKIMASLFQTYNLWRLGNLLETLPNIISNAKDMLLAYQSVIESRNEQRADQGD